MLYTIISSLGRLSLHTTLYHSDESHSNRNISSIPGINAMTSNHKCVYRLSPCLVSVSELVIFLAPVSLIQSYTPGRNRTGRVEVRPSRENVTRAGANGGWRRHYNYDGKSLSYELRPKQACLLSTPGADVIPSRRHMSALS